MLVNDSKQEQINAYIRWLSHHADEKTVSGEIQSIISLENSEETIDFIVKGLEEEYITCLELLNETDDSLEKKELHDEMTKIKSNINVIMKVVLAYRKKKEHELELEMFASSNVLFATNSYGNIMVEGDLRDIKSKSEKSEYDKFIVLLKKLMDGYRNFNEEKQRSLQKSNDQLKDLYELKDYQSRLLYRYVGEYVVVIGAATKKADFDSKFRFFCVNCKKNSEYFVNRLEKGKVDVNELKIQSLEFYSKIIGNGVQK